MLSGPFQPTARRAREKGGAERESEGICRPLSTPFTLANVIIARTRGAMRVVLCGYYRGEGVVCLRGGLSVERIVV